MALAKVAKLFRVDSVLVWLSPVQYIRKKKVCILSLLFVVLVVMLIMNNRNIVYLLDDILSALDAHVATHIVRNCVLGILRHKTRIIVTEHRRLLAIADQVLSIDNGSVTVSNPDSSDYVHDEDVTQAIPNESKPSEILSMENDGMNESTLEEV